MNAWNARSATNGNKNRDQSLAVRIEASVRQLWPFLFALVSLPPTRQSARRPAMFDVEEVVVKFAHFGTTRKQPTTCGLTRKTWPPFSAKTLHDNDVPAIAVTNAKPPMLGTARIELLPEIVLVRTAKGSIARHGFRLRPRPITACMFRRSMSPAT